MQMASLWLVKNCNEDCYNVYTSQSRAEEAIEKMRVRFGELADLYRPYAVELQEGQAFGCDVLRPGLREDHQDMVLE